MPVIERAAVEEKLKRTGVPEFGLAALCKLGL